MKYFFWVYLLVFLLCSCSDKSREKAFIEKINIVMGEDNKAITSLGEIENYNWDEVCFGYGPGVKLVFKSSDKNNDFNMMFDPEVMYINEDYVEGSPSEKCYGRNAKFIFEKGLTLNEETILVKKLPVENK